MTALRRIVVVGASVAGVCAVQELRQLGFEGEISLIGEEAVTPYDRPPLSKQILTGEQDPIDVALASDAELASLQVELLLGQAAAALDIAERSVELASGERVMFDALILATGARARRPRFVGELPGVHVLRTLRDALAIRSEIGGGKNAVVVGAGFIGAEVAASLRACALQVTLVDPLSAPLAAVLGPTVGECMAELHLRHGTVLEMGTGVSGFEGKDHVEAVVLTDGRRLQSDLVVVGVGAEPTTAWLESSGLHISDGVVCDEGGSTNVPGIYAAGDVARWRHPLFDDHVRIEHWTNARLQAGIVAENLIAGRTVAALASPPTFWSDQYDWRIQMVGAPAPGDDVLLVEGHLEKDRFVVLYGRGGRVTGALAANSPRALAAQHRLVASSASWSDAIEAVSA